MKKWIVLFLLSSSFAIAQDMNAGIEERIYKTVVINGIEVKKWVIFDTFTQYNNEQKPIYQKGPNNTEIWWKYNSKGHIKSEERKNSGITIFECDDDGRIIHSRLDAAPEVKGIIGVDVWYEYNVIENILYVHSLTRLTNDDGTISESNEYDEYGVSGKLIHHKTDNYETWYKYDENGYIYQEIDSNDNLTSYKTDINGNVIYFNKPSMENWYEYNFNGLCIYRKEKINNSLTAEYTYEYTYWDNGKVKTCSRYRF